MRAGWTFDRARNYVVCIFDWKSTVKTYEHRAVWEQLPLFVALFYCGTKRDCVRW
jgi:hypothetical protein